MLSDYDEVHISIYPERGFSDEGHSFHIVASTKNDDESFGRSVYGEYHTPEEIPFVIMGILKKLMGYEEEGE